MLDPASMRDRAAVRAGSSLRQSGRRLERLHDPELKWKGGSGCCVEVSRTISGRRSRVPDWHGALTSPASAK